jgi:D-alanyl-lipoteichoic acid acyltransferase DltB (MBOAT superfamily)
MLFNSYSIVLFLAVTLAAYWSVPARGRAPLLLLAGYVFYGAWDYRFLALLFATTVIDYAAARAIYATPDPWRRKLFLLTSLGANLGVLGFFKYYNFFVDTFEVFLAQLGIPAHARTLRIILPLGISFYTFQSMSYTIDVYRRRVQPSRDFVTYAAYVAFFPQLCAGPIERFEHLYPQLARPAVLDLGQVRAGLFLCLQGFVKKVVVADGIAPIVDEVFAALTAHNAGEVLGASLLFTLQIYCDFSGYSDIARGVAYFFGVELTENFRAPLLSRSITEFWRRWHISLSHWLRDYLYIPLGGNRHGQWATYRNLMLTMLLGGLWHGADWKFVVWGGLHGGLLALERALFFGSGRGDWPVLSRRNWPLHALAFVYTVLAVTAIFVFFRADSFGDAVDALRVIAGGEGLAAALQPRLFFAAGVVLCFDAPLRLTGRPAWILEWPLPVRLGVYTTLLASLLLLSGSYAQPFIYFAF